MKKLSLILVALLAIACLLPALAEPTTDLPSPVAIQDKQEVIGQWDFSGAALMGYYVTAEMINQSADLSAQIEVTDSSISITVTSEGNNQTGTSAWELLDDGTIKYTDPDGTTGIIVLNDDGTLSLDTETDGMAMTLYFTKVA